MRYGLILAAGIVALGACSGSSSEADGGSQGDVATGARLMRQQPLGNGTPAERMTRLAECSATLYVVADGPPPHERAQSLKRTADRLLTIAAQLAGSNGQTAADVARIHDETAAATRQFAHNQAQEYSRLIGAATNLCETGAVMTDQELGG